MAISANGTKLENLVNPQVLADMISAELPNRIALAPLAEIDRTLEGKPGNTITVPKYGYIGDAQDVAEGEDLPIAKMSTTTTEVEVKKAGIAVEFSDESVLSGYGNPVGESKKQIEMSIGNKVDNDLFASLRTATLSSTTAGTGLAVGDLFAARAKFGENINQAAVLLINSKHYASLAEKIVEIENTDNVLISGVVGKIAGLQVAISDKLSDNEAFIIAKGALGLLLKRAVMVETDRDIVARTTVIAADEHYATYLKNETKAVKITIA